MRTKIKKVIILNDHFFGSAIDPEYYNLDLIEELRGKLLTVVTYSSGSIDTEEEINEHLKKYMTLVGSRNNYFAVNTMYDVIMEM